MEESLYQAKLMNLLADEAAVSSMAAEIGLPRVRLCELLENELLRSVDEAARVFTDPPPDPILRFTTLGDYAAWLRRHHPRTAYQAHQDLMASVERLHHELEIAPWARLRRDPIELRTPEMWRALCGCWDLPRHPIPDPPQRPDRNRRLHQLLGGRPNASSYLARLRALATGCRPLPRTVARHTPQRHARLHDLLELLGLVDPLWWITVAADASLLSRQAHGLHPMP